MTEESTLGRIRHRLAIRTRMRAVRDEIRVRRTASAYARARTQPIRDGVVLYESFGGAGLLDNPEALFRHLLAEPDLQHLEHVWALDALARHPEVVGELSSRPNVRFVEVHSRAYRQALATSKFLVNNQAFPQHFAKRPGQVYVNTWHGEPLALTGYDRPGGGPPARNVVRNFLNADYLISSGPHMTDVLFRRAYRLQNLYAGAVIEEGQPRTDRQREAQQNPDTVLALLEACGLSIAGRKILLYAPAGHGVAGHLSRAHVERLGETVAHLRGALDDDWVVLVTVPPGSHDSARRALGDGRDLLVPNRVPVNLVLGVTDLLVTDFSSLSLDFVATGRPVVLYLPAVEEGAADWYVEEADLPGPVTDSPARLVEEVRRAATSEPLVVEDSGSVCKRVVDVVFRGADESSYAVRRDFVGGKERILIHLGAMRSMGITTSGLNLLRNIDYDRYDVTAFYKWSKGPDRAKNIALVDPRVRVLPRDGELNGTRRGLRAVERMMTADGVRTPLTSEHVAFWTDEWQRMFGSSSFDILIDFSGYGAYAPFLFTVADAQQKSLWLHNDMMADTERRLSGEKPNPTRHLAVFSTFPFLDRLVSVSPLLNQVNRERLAAYAPAEKFTHAVNTLEGERVRQLAEAEPVHVPSADPDVTTFVTVGRLSVEKNHDRLIRAFAKLQEEHPRTQLVIMGTGELQEQLEELVRSLGLEESVTLTGLVTNPFAVMARSRCFVLSSDYEGLPMVILEARTLGLPVVTTAFASAADSVPPEAGIVVPRSVEGLAEGMARFLRGEVRATPLDPDAYNKHAMEQFYDVIHQRDPGRIG